MNAIISPSPFDARDLFEEDRILGDTNATPATPPTPPTLDLRPHLQPIRHQGSQGSCAAQSAACMKEFQEKFDNGLDHHFSPQFIYNNRRNQSGEGMTCRDLMRVMYKIGSVFETDYAYSTVENPDVMREENPELYETAAAYKIASYARIRTIEGLKESLYMNGPCLIAVPVYHAGQDMWKRQSVDQKMSGGHAMAVVGYTEDSFIIRNSWGAHWGDGGHCMFPFSEWGSQWEAWTTVDERLRIMPEPESESESEAESESVESVESVEVDSVGSLSEIDTDTEPEPKPTPPPIVVVDTFDLNRCCRTM